MMVKTMSSNLLTKIKSFWGTDAHVVQRAIEKALPYF